MKSFTLNGAWAAQELQTREVRDRCSALEQEVVRWKSACEERDQHLAREREKLQRLENTRLPELENRLAAAEHTVRKLMDDLEQQQLATQKAQESGATAVAVLQGQLDAATADNAVLKAELAKHMHLRAATHNKVEEAKRKLGLSQPEAEFFIHVSCCGRRGARFVVRPASHFHTNRRPQLPRRLPPARAALQLTTMKTRVLQDLDETKAANKSLKAEVATLAADKARLEQQCDSRSQHAMTLIAENKRLLEQVQGGAGTTHPGGFQGGGACARRVSTSPAGMGLVPGAQVSELRKQVTASDQDLWRLRQVRSLCQGCCCSGRPDLTPWRARVTAGGFPAGLVPKSASLLILDEGDGPFR